MSKSTDRRFPHSMWTLCALTLAAVGCRNPFLPSSDIILTDFYNPRTGGEVRIYSTEITPPLNLNSWNGLASFAIRNKVAATITSINLEFTDYGGTPVTVYKATGGKTFKTHYRLNPMTGNTPIGGTNTAFTLYLVDRQVLNEITAPGYSPDRVMIVIVTFRGEDDNGYDFKLTAKLGIKYYL